MVELKSNHVGACLRLLTLCLLFISSQVTAQSPHPDFITIWEVEADIPFTFPGEGEYTIDWGDGMMEETVIHVMSVKHAYAMAGEYTIKVSDDITRFNLKNSQDGAKLKDINQWGTAKWSSMENAFQGTGNMQMSATDMPDLSAVTSFFSMFSDSTVFTGNSSMGGWNVSNVTNMAHMFNLASAFNHDIGGWDVSNVTDMSYMFSDNPKFNQNIGGWDVSRVTNMAHMFNSASAFNHDIGGWDVSSITSTAGNAHTGHTRMFTGATAFKQNLGRWYVVGTPNLNYGTADLKGLTLVAQNDALRGQDPTYTLGGEDIDKFTLAGGELTVKPNVQNGTYLVRVDVSNASNTLFGTNNPFVVRTVKIEGTTITLNPTTPDISGDGAVNGRDALLLYFVLTFREFVGDGARGSVDLTAALLGGFSTARTVEAYQERIDLMDLWVNNPTSDLSGDGEVSNRDALVAYYVLTFREFVGDGAGGSVDLTAGLLGGFSTARTVEEYQERIDAIDAHFLDPSAQ